MLFTKSLKKAVSIVDDSIEVNNDLMKNMEPSTAFAGIAGKEVESHSCPERELILSPGNSNQFVESVIMAFDRHYPVVFSPDIIWSVLSQGIARHIIENSEKLRKHFVDFEGKKEISVRRDGFKMGSPDNNWEEVFPEFSCKIEEFIGSQAHDVFVPSFSTTGRIEKVCSQICLMDAMKNFFEYKVFTMCGIPEIIILGKKSDWKKIKTKIQIASKWDLEWWTSYVIPIIDKFISSYDEPDPSFWKGIYSRNYGSGVNKFQGWITNLFPYGVENRRYYRRSNIKSRLSLSNIPPSVSDVPFIWNYYGEEHPYRFIGGLFAISQDKETKALRPEFGWAVCPA